MTDDMAMKRQLLASFRMRFAPEVQQTRENLVDSFVQQALLDVETGFTVSDIQHKLNSGLRVNLAGDVILDSLKRLIASEIVEECGSSLQGVRQKGNKKLRYRLAPSARDRIWKQADESTNRFDSVCRKLFADAETRWAEYAEPFFRFLSSVFSRLAGENYRMIRGEVSHSEVMASSAFVSALDSVKGDLRSLDRRLFESAAEAFFRDPDPDYAAVKWNMAQNYYALRVIGIDRQTMAEEVFADAEFCLDTNVVISALEPSASHHRAFLSLWEVCGRLGSIVRVLEVTLKELDKVVAYQRDMLAKVIEQIPTETACKISSDFFEVYVDRKKSQEAVDMDALFANFDNPEEKLRDSYNVEIEEDPWFDQMESEDVVSEFADAVRDRYLKMRNRKKGDPAAKHDALCLLWVEERRQEHKRNAWLVTRDHTLPGCVPPESESKTLAVTLDALMQWLSPMVVDLVQEEDIALAYSEIISSRILPQERIFDLEDFVIFHELEMTCRSLPPEDVEGCIRHIKHNMPLLNPSNAADREKLARSIAVYLADPSRKYRENVERYESEISTLRDRIDRQTEVSARRDAWLRVSHLALVFIVLEAAVLVLAATFGSGANTFQRIVNSWPFIVLPLAICVVLGWFYLGRERLRLLGWPLSKLFKSE